MPTARAARRRSSSRRWPTSPTWAIRISWSPSFRPLHHLPSWVAGPGGFTLADAVPEWVACAYRCRRIGRNTAQGRIARSTMSGARTASRAASTTRRASASTRPRFPQAIKLEWDWPDVYKPEIYAYPEIIFGYKPWDPGTGAKDFIAPVDELKAFTADFDLAIAGPTPSTSPSTSGSPTRPAGGPSSITTEVMIWLHSGVVTPAGHQVASYHGNGYDAAIWREKSHGRRERRQLGELAVYRPPAGPRRSSAARSISAISCRRSARRA